MSYTEEIASIRVRAVLDKTDLNRSLNYLNTNISTIKITVDDSALTDLNKHLSLKQKHLSEVRRDFATPIRVSYSSDSSAIDRDFDRIRNKLNNQSFSFPIEIDDRNILNELSSIKKAIQAQTFTSTIQLKPIIDTDSITKQLENSIFRANTQVNVKIKDTINASGTQSNEISIGFKSLEKSLNKISSNTANRGLLGNIVTGFQEQIGVAISKQVAMGIKDVVGKDPASMFRSATRSGGKAVKQIFFDNKEFIEASKEAESIIGERLKKAGYRLGDGIVAALENRTGTAMEKLNSAISTMFEQVDVSNLSKDLIKEFSEVGQKLGAGILSETALKKITEPIGQKIKERRVTALEERAIPLVEQRALNILAGGKKTKKGDYKGYETANYVDENTKELILTSGGYAGFEGHSGKRLALELEKQKVPGRKAIAVRNMDSDLPKDAMNNAQDKLIALLTSISKPNIRGYSKDAVEIAAQAVAARERNPEISIKIMGESGGGFAAEEASKILDMMGIKNDFIGVGTPRFHAALDNKDRKIISPDEMLGAETNSLYKRVGMAEITPSQRIMGVMGHPYENYRDAGVAELQNFMHGSPGVTTPDLMTDFKAGADYFKGQDKSKLDGRQIEQLSEAAYKNMQHIRRYMLEATGDTKIELEGIVTDFEGVFVDLQPDNKEISEVRKSIDKASEYLKYLRDQPGLEAGMVAKNIVKELEPSKKILQEGIKKNPGMGKAKYEKALKDISAVQQKLLDPSIAIKPILEKPITLPPLPTQDIQEIKPEKTQELVAVIEEVTKNIQVMTQEEIDEKIKEISTQVEAFQNQYKNQFKTALTRATKTGDKVGLREQGYDLLKFAPAIRSNIEQTKKDIGLSGIGGKTENNSLNQKLSLVSRTVNTVTQKLSANNIDVPEFESIGKNVAGAIAIGIEKTPDAVEAIGNLSEEIKLEAKKQFEIQSPSKYFIGIGKFISEGLDLGLSNISKIPIGKYLKNILIGGLTSIKSIFDGFNSGASDGVKNLIGNLTAAQFVFSTITDTLPKLKAFTEESTRVAIDMQRINNQVVAAAGGGSGGVAYLREIRKNSEDLRLNIKDSLEASAGFSSSTVGTTIEGQLGTETFKNFQTLLAARGTTSERSKNFLLALEQSASKGVQAEELRGQMAEAVPGIISIFARSQGLDNRGFAAKMKNTPGGLDQSVLFEASQQAKAENLVNIAKSFDTVDSASNRFDNNILKLQESVGDLSLEFEKFKFNSLSAGFELISNNIGLITKGLTVLAVYSSQSLIVSGLQAIAKGWILSSTAIRQYMVDYLLNIRIQTMGMSPLQKAGFIANNTFNKLSSTIGGFTNIAKPFVAIAIGMEAISNVATLLRIQFTDLSGDIKKYADTAKTANVEIEKSLKTGVVDENGGIGADNRWSMRVKKMMENPLRALNPFDQTDREGYKKASDTYSQGNKLIKESEKLRGIAESDDINKKISELAEIDKKRGEITAKLSARSQLSPGDSPASKALREQQDALIKDRGDKIVSVGAVQSQIESRIKELKLLRDSVKTQAENGYITKDNYLSGVTAIDDELKKLESTQDRITKSIGESKNAFDIFKKSITSAVVAAEDIHTAIETRSTSRRTVISDQYARGNYNQGDRNLLNQFSDIRTAQEQRSAQARSINQQSELFRSQQASSVLSAYGVNGSTGIAKIGQLADGADGNNKFILEQYAKLHQSKQEFVKTQQQLADANASLKDYLTDLNKSLKEYYTGIEREVKQTAIEINKTSAGFKFTDSQNKIREALTNGADNMFTQFADGIIANIDKAKQRSDASYESSSTILGIQNKIADSTKSYSEIRKTIPKIPIELDFSSVNSNENVTSVNDSLAETQKRLDDTSDQFNNINGDVDRVGGSLDKNNQSIYDQIGSITKVLDTTGEIVDKTDMWNDGLSQIRPTTDNISNSFTTIGSSIESLISQTLNWLDSLTKGDGILGGLVASARSLMAGNTGNSLVDGAVGAVKGLFGVNESINQSGDKKFGGVSFVANSRSSMDSDGGHIGDDIFAPIGSKIYAPVGGTIVQSRVGGTKNTDDANPLAPGYQPQQLVILKLDMPIEFEGKKITHFNMRHLLERNVEVGQKVKMGDLLGTIGEAGGRGTQFGTKNPGTAKDADASHLHIEYSPQENNQRDALGDASASKLSTLLSSQFKKSVSLGGSTDTITRSTPASIGKVNLKDPRQVAQLPQVQAFLKAVAVAEVGEKLVSSGGGYGKSIGGTYGVDDFKNPERLTRIPPNPRGGKQTAFGRYQLHQVDVDEHARMFGKGVPNLSPENQDILGAGRLIYRKVIPALMSGDLNTAIKLAGKEFASLEGSPYRNDGLNKQTDGGSASVIKSNYVKFLGDGRTAVGGVTSAYKDQQTSYNGQINVEQQRATRDQRQQDLQAEREKNQNLRALDRNIRSQKEDRRSSSREVSDSHYEAGGIKSPTQQYKKRIVDNDRKYADMIGTREQKLKEINEAIASGQSLLQTLPPDDTANRQKVSEALKQNQGYVKDLTTQIAQLRTDQKTSNNNITKEFNQEETFKSEKFDFQLASQNIEKQRSVLEQAKKQVAIAPDSELQGEINLTERDISLKSDQLDLETKLQEIRERLFKKETTLDRAKQETEALFSLNDEKKRGIELTYEQAEAERKQTYGQITIDKAAKSLEYQNELRAEQIKQLGLLQRRNPLIDSMKGIDLERQTATDSNTNSTRAKIFEATYNKNYTPDERAGLIARENELSAIRQKNIDDEATLRRDEQSKTDIDTRNSRAQQLREFSSTSDIELKRSRATKISDLGGNPIRANRLNREAGAMEETNRFKTSMEDLESKVAGLRFQGIEVSESAVTHTRENLEAIHKLNIDDLNRKYMTFGDTLNSVARQGFGTLSSSLSDLILKGGSFSDVLDNFANTILSGALNAGFSSLFGGLFGGLFYDGGIVGYADGGIIGAHKKERAMSGREPRMIMAHVGELLVPADRVEELKGMGLGTHEILGYANGGVVGSPPASTMRPNRSGGTVKIQTTVINKQEYASVEQVQAAMDQAQRMGAMGGFEMVQDKMTNDSNFRSATGLNR
jgi:tape measure domain-containing protein